MITRGLNTRGGQLTNGLNPWRDTGATPPGALQTLNVVVCASESVTPCASATERISVRVRGIE